MSVRANEHPTYLNQSPSEIFERIGRCWCLELAKKKKKKKWRVLTFLGGEGGERNSHAVAPKLHSLTNKILDY